MLQCFMHTGPANCRAFFPAPSRFHDNGSNPNFGRLSSGPRELGCGLRCADAGGLSGILKQAWAQQVLFT